MTRAIGEQAIGFEPDRPLQGLATFLILPLAGGAGGTLQALLLMFSVCPLGEVSPNHQLWDLAQLQGLAGLAIGTAVGTGIAVFRKSWQGLLASIGLGFALVAVAIKALALHQSTPVPEDWSVGGMDCVEGDGLAWGLYLGAPMAGLLAVAILKLGRCNSWKRIWLVAVPAFLAVSVLGQWPFNQQWNSWWRGTLNMRCMVELPTTPIWMGSWLPGLMILLGTVAARQRRRLPVRALTVLGLGLLSAVGLFMALKYIPLPNSSGSVALSPDGKTVISGHSDSTIRLSRVREGTTTWGVERLGHQRVQRGGIRSLALSSDGRVLVSAAGDQSLCLWDATDLTLVQKVLVPEGRIQAVAITSDGTKIAAGAWDRHIRRWNVTRIPGGKPLELVEQPPLNGDTKNLTQLVFSPEGGTLYSSGGAWLVRRSDVSGGNSNIIMHSSHARAGASVTMALSPDGTLLATQERFEKRICLWDAATGALRLEITSPAHSIAFSPSGDVLVAMVETSLEFWDARNGSLLETQETALGSEWSYGSLTTAAGTIAGCTLDGVLWACPYPTLKSRKH